LHIITKERIKITIFKNKGDEKMEIIEQPQAPKQKRLSFKKQQPAITEGQAPIETKHKRSWKNTFTKRRKLMILAGMFVLLIVTGYLNFSLNSGTPVGGGGGAQAVQCMFTFTREQRTTQRNVQLSTLNSIINNSNDPAEVERASNARHELLAIMEFEGGAERLIKNREIVEDVIVEKSTSGNVNVVARSPRPLTPDESRDIQTALHDTNGSRLNLRSMTISVHNGGTN